MRLVVGPERQHEAACALAGPTDLLLLRSPSAGDSPGVTHHGRRLELRFNDIAEPRSGFVAPDAALVGRILAFGRQASTLTILCYAGVSRSTAAAYVLACQAAGPGEEGSLAQALRSLSPAASPNPLMVALADAALGRGGRMVRAIGSIGRGADAFEGPLFAWSVVTAGAWR